MTSIASKLKTIENKLRRDDNLSGQIDYNEQIAWMLFLKSLELLEEKREKPRPKVEFEVGESIKIKAGPFENYDGQVEDVDPSKGRVRVAVSIFGRSTSVDVEFANVEKV